MSRRRAESSGGQHPQEGSILRRAASSGGQHPQEGSILRRAESSESKTHRRMESRRVEIIGGQEDRIRAGVEPTGEQNS
jgi:hypothetical protein